MENDISMRKLRIPPKFMPYLERHRIYDLFYELGCVLGVNRPPDHLLFIKNTLAHMNETRNKPRLILLLSPFMERKLIADGIAKLTGQVVISKNDVIQPGRRNKAKEIAERMHTRIMENDLNSTGWIFYDYPSNTKEAEELLKTGTIPTHTFLFIPISKTKTPKELWLENLDQWTTNEIKDAWIRYQRVILNFRMTFKETLLEIKVICKTFDEILKECSKLVREFPIRGPRVSPRLVLIGCRGSRRSQLAQRLSEKLHIVPVDMNDIIEEAKLGDTDIAEQIRFLDNKKVPLYPSIILKLLKDRLLQEDCLTKGWVLIRFPRNRGDLQALDSFDTPPNRVIILTTNEETEKKLTSKRWHMFTSMSKSIQEIRQKQPINDEDNYFTHPLDVKDYVASDRKSFTSHFQELLQYCGEDCAVISAIGSIDTVVERIEGAIGRGLGQGDPRPGNLNHRKAYKDENVNLVGKPGDPVQLHTDLISSDPYLFQSSYRTPTAPTDVIPDCNIISDKECSNDTVN